MLHTALRRIRLLVAPCPALSDPCLPPAEPLRLCCAALAKPRGCHRHEAPVPGPLYRSYLAGLTGPTTRAIETWSATPVCPRNTCQPATTSTAATTALPVCCCHYCANASCPAPRWRPEPLGQSGGCQGGGGPTSRRAHMRRTCHTRPFRFAHSSSTLGIITPIHHPPPASPSPLRGAPTWGPWPWGPRDAMGKAKAWSSSPGFYCFEVS